MQQLTGSVCQMSISSFTV